jgi:hypothetical protein
MMVTLFATSSYANDCIDIRGPSNSFSRNDSLCNEDGTIKTKKVTKEVAKKLNKNKTQNVIEQDGHESLSASLITSLDPNAKKKEKQKIVVRVDKIDKEKERNKLKEEVALKDCVAPTPLPDVEVPLPTIARVNLEEIRTTRTTTSAETLLELINYSKPDNYEDLDDNQILAAVYRQNPHAFDNNGVIGNQFIRIPSRGRMLLEHVSTGEEIFRLAKIGKLKTYRQKIPALVIPWEIEDKIIAEKKAEKKARDEAYEKLIREYNACIVDNKIKAQLIPDNAIEKDVVLKKTDELADSLANEVYLREIIDNKNAISNANDKIENLEKQLRDLTSLLKSGAIQSSQSKVYDSELISTLKDIKGAMEELQTLKDDIEVLKQKATTQEEKTSEIVASAQMDDEFTYIIFGSIAGVFLISVLGVIAFFKKKKDSLRQNQFADDEDDIDVSATETDILGNINIDPADYNEKSTDAHQSAIEPKIKINEGSAQTPESSAATNSQAPKSEGATKSTEGSTDPNSSTLSDIPNLEAPDESIRERQTESPDLVPSRHIEGTKDESKKDDSIKNSLEPKVINGGLESKSNVGVDLSKHDSDVMDAWASALNESKGEAPKSDADVMDEWASALSESKEETPKSDADVMDEWASALSESKEEAPKSDADVMDEWAAALSESKEETPKSDADVMDEWAAALSESKEEAPKSDADVMDEWAAALSESKEEAPKSDADVMDEWAAALSESKEEAPKSDADVMDEWAAALNESKK